MILDQQDRDNAVQDLLKKLSEVYTFMIENGRLAEIVTMQELYGKLARQTLECADFIVHYSETKTACKSSPLRSSPLDTQCVISCTGRRLARDVFKETGTLIQCYNDVLDALMKQRRDGAICGIVIDIYRFGKSCP